LAKPAPELARAAGTVTQFLAPEDDWADMFRGFDRHGMHAAWKRRGAQAIERGASAGATAVE